jgi:hypothetical protein
MLLICFFKFHRMTALFPHCGQAISLRFGNIVDCLMLDGARKSPRQGDLPAGGARIRCKESRGVSTNSVGWNGFLLRITDDETAK